jgi:8-oxo-dGTP diphosphatase
MVEVVCGVIENGDGCYLACLRPIGKHLGGLWEFPGGKVEPGEFHEAALIRELREELGIEVMVGTALEPVCWKHDHGEIRLRPYLCEITGGHLQPHEHERICWCALRDFETLEWAPADLPVIDQIRQRSAGAIPP